MARIRDALPSGLSSSAAGTIRTRQTTYWDLDFAEPSHRAARVHFINKREFHYVSAEFSEAFLSHAHSVLADYSEPFRQLFVSRPVSAPEVVTQHLSELVRSWSRGWRSFAHYANPQCDPLRILRGGYGLLLLAPRTLATAAERLLVEHGTQPYSLPGGEPGDDLQVLCLGPNFVVARHFDFERTTA
jgi:hypothetical protein